MATTLSLTINKTARRKRNLANLRAELELMAMQAEKLYPIAELGGHSSIVGGVADLRKRIKSLAARVGHRIDALKDDPLIKEPN